MAKLTNKEKGIQALSEIFRTLNNNYTYIKGLEDGENKMLKLKQIIYNLIYANGYSFTKRGTVVKDETATPAKKITKKQI